MSEPKIVELGVVSGPAGGKTEVIANLRKEFGTSGPVLFVPEMSTLLKDGGYPMPSVEEPWNLAWQYRFQDVIFRGQLSMDEEYRDRARRRKYERVVIVKDRTLKCGAPYFPGRLQEFCARYSVTDEELNKREYLIFQLESLATAGPAEFARCNRMEEIERAQDLERGTQMIWASHDRRIVLKGMVGVATKTERLIGVIQTLLVSS